jgi:hypothetical protein
LHKAARACLQCRAYGSAARNCAKPSAKGRAHRAADQAADKAAKPRQQIATATARPARAAAKEACETAAGASGPGAATVKHIAEVVEAKDRHVQVPLAALRPSYQNTAVTASYMGLGSDDNPKLSGGRLIDVIDCKSTGNGGGVVRVDGQVKKPQ